MKVLLMFQNTGKLFSSLNFFKKQEPEQENQTSEPTQSTIVPPNPSFSLFDNLVRVPQTLNAVFIKEHDRRIKTLQRKLPVLAKSVRKDGLYTMPQMVLGYIHARIQEDATKIMSEINWEISEIMTSQTLISDKLAGADMEEHIAAYERYYEPQKEEERKPFLAKLDTLPVKNEELDQTEEREEASRNTKNDLLEERYNNEIPERRFYHNTSVYTAIIVSIFVVEAPINFIAVQAIGEMINAAIIPVTLVVSLLVAYGSHAIGEAIAEGRKKIAIAITSVVMALCFVILVLRFNGEGAFILTVLNFVAVGFGSFFSYIRNFGMAYFSAEAAENAARLEAAAQRGEIKKIEEGVPSDLKALDDKYTRIATQHVMADRHNLEEAFQQNKQGVQRLGHYKTRRQEEFNGLYDKAISDWQRHTVTMRQKKNLAPVVWSDYPIPPLKFE